MFKLIKANELLKDSDSDKYIFLDSDDLEKELHIKKETQKKYRRLQENNPKKLKYIRLGKRVYYRKLDIKEWIENNVK